MPEPWSRRPSTASACCRTDWLSRLVACDGEDWIGDARRNGLHAVGRTTHVRQRAASRLARERRVLGDRHEGVCGVGTVGEHRREERIAPGASVHRAGEREEIVRRVLGAHVTEIGDAAERGVGRSDVRLNRQRLFVGAIDDDAHRAGNARVDASGVVVVAVEVAVVVDRTGNAVWSGLDVRAPVSTRAGASGEGELHAAVGSGRHATSDRLALLRLCLQRLACRREKRGGGNVCGSHYGLPGFPSTISRSSCEARGSFLRVST